MEALELTRASSSQRAASPRTLVSICVVTYRRRALLEKLLESLEAQELPEGSEAEIVVVDNDLERSAESTVRQFQSRGRARIHYFVEPVKNISLARNTAVEQAKGRYLLFIDDDEVASPHWVRQLLSTLEAFGADGAFGGVRAHFDSEVPEWMSHTDLTQTPVKATGERASFKWSGNCILRREVLQGAPGPFDPRYGLTGGEDTHLFDRLERQGARFVYCGEAWVSEYWPAGRTRSGYLFSRGLKGGNTHTRRVIEAAGAGRPLIRLLMLLKGLSFGVISLVLAMVFLPSPYRRTRWLMRVGSNVGRLMAAFGWHYRAYR